VTNPFPWHEIGFLEPRSRGGECPTSRGTRSGKPSAAQEVSCQFIARMELIGESQHSGDVGANAV